MEGIPVALMEAMASGLPVISTRHSGIPELIQDKVSGLLAGERNVEELCTALEITLRDPAARSKRAFEARKTVEREFNSQLLNEQFERLLSELPNPESTSKPIEQKHDENAKA